MRNGFGVALVLCSALGVLALGASGCRSGGKKAEGVKAPDMAIKDFKVVWTRGGKLGYLKTYDVSEPGQPKVRIHYVEDVDFRQVGWVADDGQGERFDYPAAAIGEAKRAVFDRIALPVDTIENQVRRIFQVDPETDLAFQRATEADIRR